MNKAWERIYNGLIKENPTLVLTLGMCPTLAVTTSAINGAGMGVSTMVVLILSNVFISLLRKIIPDKVRIPAFIVIIASFVTVVQLLLQAYLPSLYDSLGIYIPLIVVNCIILGRAEAYAYSNPVFCSLFDGLGMGLGFTVALTLIGACRELLGAGAVFGFQLLGPDNVFYGVDALRPLAMFLGEYTNISIFIMAPGAFFVLAFIIAAMNRIRRNAAKKGKKIAPAVGCGFDCASCGEAGCAQRKSDEPEFDQDQDKHKEPELEMDQDQKPRSEMDLDMDLEEINLDDEEPVRDGEESVQGGGEPVRDGEEPVQDDGESRQKSEKEGSVE